MVIWELTIVKNKEGNETKRQQGPTTSEVRFNQISQIFNGEKKKKGTGVLAYTSCHYIVLKKKVRPTSA